MPVDPVLYLSFLGATVFMIATPGPIVSLIIGRTLEDGPAHGIAIALGAAVVSCAFLAAALLGLTGAAALNPVVFDIIRYFGALLILWMAVQAWRKTPTEFGANALATRHQTLWKDFRLALIVTSASPKTILFFIAFFPQFVSADLPRSPQLWAMAVGFLVVSLTLDMTWVSVARWARSRLLSRGAQKSISRLSASVLALAAVLLIVMPS